VPTNALSTGLFTLGIGAAFGIERINGLKIMAVCIRLVLLSRM
jgi:hypothetical protein